VKHPYYQYFNFLLIGSLIRNTFLPLTECLYYVALGFKYFIYVSSKIEMWMLWSNCTNVHIMGHKRVS